MAQPEKLAVLVYGPESSGNRLLARLLVAAGCIGDGGHFQRWETQPPTGESPIVWLRSLPLGTAHDWPDIAPQIALLRQLGYAVRLLSMRRDWHFTALSQVHNGHVVDYQAGLRNIRRAERLITRASQDVPWWSISYEALVAHPLPVLNAALRFMGLAELTELPAGDAIFDGNYKYANLLASA